MNKAEKEARKLRKALHEHINFESLTSYIEKRDYSVIIFTDTHKLLKRYVLEETAKTKSAFTYVDKHTKLIFIRETLHASDKLLLLLHEIGHVVLGHMEGEHLRVTDKYETEYEADHFAHLVLCPKKLPAFLKPLGAFILATSLLTSLSFNYIQYNNHIQSTEQIINTTAVTPPQQEQENNVYITATGSKYHTSDCTYATNSAEIRLEEAKKLFSPCKKCNP